VTPEHFLVRVFGVYQSVVVSKLCIHLSPGLCTTGPLETSVSRQQCLSPLEEKIILHIYILKLAFLIKTYIFIQFILVIPQVFVSAVSEEAELMNERILYSEHQNIVRSRIEFSCGPYFANPLLHVVHEPLHLIPDRWLVSGSPVL